MTRRTSYLGEWISWVWISWSCLSPDCHLGTSDTDSRTSLCCNGQARPVSWRMTMILSCLRMRRRTRRRLWIWTRMLTSAAASLCLSAVSSRQVPVSDEQTGPGSSELSECSVVSGAYTESPSGGSGCLGSWSRNHNYHRRVSGSQGSGLSYTGLSRWRQQNCSATWKLIYFYLKLTEISVLVEPDNDFSIATRECHSLCSLCFTVESILVESCDRVWQTFVTVTQSHNL